MAAASSEPSPVFYFHWYHILVVISTVAMFFVILLATLKRYRLIKASLLVLFVLSVLSEACINIRDQFPTTPNQKLDLTLGSLLIAVIVVAVTFRDVYTGLKNHMPMQGRWVILADNRRIFVNQKLFGKLENAFILTRQMLKHSSLEDRIRLGASLIQFILRSVEFKTRLFCDIRVCKILSTGISGVPILLAMVCLAQRFVRKLDSPQNAIVCILVGDFERRGDDLEDPSSELWAQSKRFNITLANTVGRTFDMWNTVFSPRIGNEHWNFTLMEMKHPENDNNDIWYFPPADFVILHFSVRNRESYDAINNRWINFVNGHNKKCRVIVIGTDAEERRENDVTEAEGYQLAYAANAVSYIELASYTEDRVEQLFSKIVSLIE